MKSLHVIVTQMVDSRGSEHYKLLSELVNCQSLKTQLEYRLQNIESDLKVHSAVSLEFLWIKLPKINHINLGLLD